MTNDKSAYVVPSLELWASVAISAALVLAHATLLFSTGALWRDEINSINVAAAPLSRLPSLLQFDSYPAGYFLVLKSWLAFAHTDFSIRVLGFITGLALLAAIWICSYVLVRRPPLLALVLVAGSATLVRHGDAIRGAGIGAVAAVLLLTVLWRDVNVPSRSSYAVAVLTACASVQLAYLNVIAVFAGVVAAIAVTARRGSKKEAARAFSIGALAAVTFLPYFAVLGEARKWNGFLRLRFDTERLIHAWRSALSQEGVDLTLVWGGALLVALLVITRRRSRTRFTDLQIYTLALVLATTAACVLALAVLRYPMLPWYFITWIVATGLAIDVFVAEQRSLGFARVLFALVASVLILPSTFTVIRQHVTNVDAIARFVESRSCVNDMIVIYPFTCGISFARYYEGPSPWETFPPVADSAVHRFDILAARRSDQRWLEPYLADLQQVLTNGGRVWLISLATPPGQPIVGSTVYDELDARLLARLNSTLLQSGIAEGPPQFLSSAAGGAYELMWLQLWKGRQSRAAVSATGIIISARPVRVRGVDNPSVPE